MKYYVTGKISENIRETPEGYLLCLGVPIARTGEMEYGPNETPLKGDRNGYVRITRDENEVFRPQTIASFEGKAFTIGHPDEFVSPDNWKELAKGILQNIRRGKNDYKDSLIADILVTDAMAIGLVRSGLREVSCGYEADYIQEDDEEGTGKQVNIIGNHLALVDQGRAGPEYAIMDSKGEKKMSLKDQVKALFSKAQDDATKLIEEATKETKDTKAKKTKDEGEEKPAGYDELVKMVDALGEKMDKMMGAKDQDQGEKEQKMKDDDGEEKKEESKDDDDKESEIMNRLMTLEKAVEKILGHIGDEMEESKDEDDKEDKKDDKAKDEEGCDDDEEEMEDDDFEESNMVGDEVYSRAEILAPGIKKSKDMKIQALKTAYSTTDGKKVIDSLTGGKGLKKLEAKEVDTLFIAASEVVKASRKDDLVNTKKVAVTDWVSSFGENKGMMTPEKLNEINAKHYAKNA